MADYIFDDWKTMLGNFQDCVQKDLEEIHKQKAEIQQMKADLFKEMEGFKYYRDEQRLILSAPEVIIGNVDESGDLMGCTGKIILNGHEVQLNGVGDTGHIVSRAPSIRQIAVNPGSDGIENVVCETSEIVNQACNIVLESNDATDARKHMEYHPLAQQKAGRHMEPFVIDINPEDSPEFQLSAHEGEEFIYVMQGEVEIVYGKETYKLGEGDSIFYDSIVKHHVHGAPGKSAKILAVVYIPF
jgi:quercetin dioxygenase-like cupin family protein